MEHFTFKKKLNILSQKKKNLRFRVNYPNLQSIQCFHYNNSFEATKSKTIKFCREANVWDWVMRTVEIVSCLQSNVVGNLSAQQSILRKTMRLHQTIRTKSIRWSRMVLQRSSTLMIPTHRVYQRRYVDTLNNPENDTAVAIQPILAQVNPECQHNNVASSRTLQSSTSNNSIKISTTLCRLCTCADDAHD